MNDCIFCKIIKGEIPCEKIYEDDEVFAFLDINPINPGHTLIVPKKHYENLYELPDSVLCAMAPVVKKLARVIKESVGADGINIGMNNDPAAGQVVPHAHIHIMPRFKNDRHEMWHGEPYKEGEISKIAEKIKNNL